MAKLYVTHHLISHLFCIDVGHGHLHASVQSIFVEV